MPSIGIGIGLNVRRGGGKGPQVLILDEDGNAIEDGDAPGLYWAAFTDDID